MVEKSFKVPFGMLECAWKTFASNLEKEMDSDGQPLFGVVKWKMLKKCFFQLIAVASNNMDNIKTHLSNGNDKPEQGELFELLRKVIADNAAPLPCVRKEGNQASGALFWQ